MVELIKLNSYPVSVLERLLEDKTTKQNIIFATDAYVGIGEGLTEKDRITYEKLYGFTQQIELQTRVEKAEDEQQARTRKKAEVFTPSWIVNRMNNYCDTEWFGRENVFNTEQGQSWTTNTEPIPFEEKRTWQKYVDSKRIEITCGEAPFIVSRYDAATGEIIPIENRIGILDRKLRAVNENAADDKEWLKWTQRAFESSYGYEYQGDNLLIARINVLLTFSDYYSARFNAKPDEKLMKKFVNIICWNFWQMDGLTGTTPFAVSQKPEDNQMPIDNITQEQPEPTETEPASAPICRVMDWRADCSVSYDTIRGGNKGMKWDFAIGNPPYQEDTKGDNETFAPPVYHLFMDAAYAIADKVELIHKANFLFNAGSTPKAWNEKMLNDPHFKVLDYQEDASKVFSNTEIKGGVVITYHDAENEYGAIQVFTKHPATNAVLKKAAPKSDEDSLMSVIYIQNRFNLNVLLTEHPEFKSSIGSDGKDSRFEKNIFAKIPLFVETDTGNCVRTLGIHQNKRVWRYIPIRFVDVIHENLEKYKIVVPVANGSGEFGQTLSTPVLEKPHEAYTRSFIGIGSFDTEFEANSALKYIKSKFARTMLSILKVTQMTNRDTWKYVPLQDFTEASDIDWSASIANIDKQLYKKYGLSQEEIDFIETHVKEME